MDRNKLSIPKNVVNFDTPNREKFMISTISNNKSIVIGKGSFGIVVRASYKGKNVAVKILEKEKSKIFKYESLKYEANILNLNHENIVKIFKIIDSKKFGAIIMEILDGYSLQYIINSCKIDLVHRLWISQDIAAAVHFCHSNNIIHSDLKAQNIIVAMNPGMKRSYICKLFDFGCSLRFADNEDVDTKYFKGTIRYMSPEMLQGLKITPAVDIYSFGIILWQLKEGKYPYEKITNNDFVVYNVVKKQLRPDTELDSYSSDDFEEDLKLCKNNRSNTKILSHFKTEQFLTANLKKIQEIINLSSSPKLHKSDGPKIIISSPESDRKKSIKINLFRKKLFDPKTNQKLKNEIQDFHQMFIHSSQLELSSQEDILNAEMEYCKLYKACWGQESTDRPNAQKIEEILKHCLSKF